MVAKLYQLSPGRSNEAFTRLRVARIFAIRRHQCTIIFEVFVVLASDANVTSSKR